MIDNTITFCEKYRIHILFKFSLLGNTGQSPSLSQTNRRWSSNVRRKKDLQPLQEGIWKDQRSSESHSPFLDSLLEYSFLNIEKIVLKSMNGKRTSTYIIVMPRRRIPTDSAAFLAVGYRLKINFNENLKMV